MKTFRQRLVSARQAKGLSQAQAARRISPKLSVRTLQAWELDGKHGRSPPAWAWEIILEKILQGA